MTKRELEVILDVIENGDNKDTIEIIDDLGDLGENTLEYEFEHIYFKSCFRHKDNDFSLELLVPNKGNRESN